MISTWYLDIPSRSTDDADLEALLPADVRQRQVDFSCPLSCCRQPHQQILVVRQHQSVNTFACIGFKKRVYAQMCGISVVNQFNRVPQLLTVVCRRVLVLVGHYFDGSIQFEYDVLGAKTKPLNVRQRMTCEPQTYRATHRIATIVWHFHSPDAWGTWEHCKNPGVHQSVALFARQYSTV